MKINWTVMVLLFFCVSLVAQERQKDYFLYQITSTEAWHLAVQEDFDPDSSYFYQLVDSSHTSSFKKFPYGHFLLVHAEREQIEVSLLNRSSIRAKVLDTNEDLMIEVQDSNGQVIKDALVTLGKKTIPFDVSTQSYFRKKWKKKNSQLSIQLGKEWLIYHLKSEKQKRYRYRRPFFSRINPLRWVKNWYRKITQPRNPEYKGYMVLNQPRFRPGDTLKLKAYLTNEKGKALNETLRLDLHSRGKKVWEKMIQPEKKGRYHAELVLDDSLDLFLDQHQSLTFRKKHRGKWVWVYRHTFKYEDYQLDETEYFLNISKLKYEWGEPVEIEAFGQYKTGLYLPDASVQLELLISPNNRFQPSHFFDREVRFNQLIWSHEQALKVGGPDQIILPETIFPKVEAKYQLKAQFQDSSGELHERSIYFSVSTPDTLGNCLHLSLEGAEIVGQSICSDSLLKPYAWLTSDYYEWETTEKVKLPFRKQLDGTVGEYSLSQNQQHPVYLDFSDYTHQITTRGENRKDSLLIRLDNPHGLAIHYELYKEKKLLQQGKTSDPYFHIARKGAQQTFRLHYRYHWKGALRKEQASFPFYKKQLKIDLVHQATVVPGQTTQVKIKVKNYKGEAVENVDLTAGAINGQFDEMNHFTGPTIEYRRAKYPRVKRKYRIEEKPLERTEKINAFWLDRLNLRDRWVYQLHYPKEGVHLHYQSLEQDSFYRNIAQFAPYIVKDGVAQPIYLIYANKQLVYYYDVHDQPPYSFIGRPGKNEIRIRTRDAEYRIDHLDLRKGHKLEFSIDADHNFTEQWGQKITRKSMPTELTDQEKKLIRNSIFILKINDLNTYILQQGNQNIHLFQTQKLQSVQKVSNRRLFKIGPFLPTQIDYHAYNKIKRKIDFEPAYSYVVEANRERLYRYDWENLEEPLPKKWSLKAPGDLIFRPADLEAFEHPDLAIVYDKNSSRTSRKKPGATYVFKAPPKDPGKLLFILEKDTAIQKILPASITSFRNLRGGTYTLYQLNRDGSYWQQTFSINEREWLFQDLSDKVLVTDTTYSLFKKVLPEKYHDQLSEIEQLLEYKKQRQLIGNSNKGWGETGTLTGIVLDKDTGEPILFANVLIKGTDVGTTTDFDGRFALEVPYQDYELVVSYVGYEDHVIRMNAPRGELEILIESSNILLESVVVTGYSKSKVSSLLSKDISALASVTAGVSTVDGVRTKQEERVPEVASQAVEPLPSGIQLRKDFKDYAAWQPRLSTDENGEAYYTIRYPDNTTLWKHYVIGMNEKREAGIAISDASAYKKVMARLSVPRFFIVGDESDVLGKSLNYRGDTLAIESTFKLDQELVQSRKHFLAEALIEKAKLKIPNRDSLQLTYTLRSGDYSDGEEYRVPVFSKGVEETVGGFYFLDRDTSLNLEFDPANGPIEVRAEQDVLNVFKQSIDYLIRYPYGCNEQLASQLTANLLAKKIKQQRKEPFKNDPYIEEGIKKLTKRQQPEGHWGWWTERQPDLWMTTYVLRALHEAKQMNYHVPALDKGLVYLTNNLEKYKGRQLLNVLALLDEVGQNLDYEKALQNVRDSLKQINLNERLTIAKIRQSQQLPIDLEAILAERQQTLFGASYWGKKQYHWYDNDVQNTLLVYQIFKRANRPDIYRSIEHYLLRQRQRQSWRNTFETARIIATLLPTYLEEANALLPNRNTFTIGDQTINTQNFPFTSTIVGETNLLIKKTGRLPIYLTIYQQRWNPQPEPVSDHFVVDSWLEQGGQKTKDIKTGAIAQLRVKVEVKRKAEYVQLEVPISAACSYENKRQSYSYHSGEIYREYFKDRVAIYCRSLKPGTYYFSIDLEPRFTGKYTLNPAKMEEMYFPVFYGRNGLKEVKVK